MVDITLYGNLTKDIIFDEFNQYHTLGSIANVWDSLMKLNPNLSVHLEPTDIGSAIIYVDKKTNTRFSKPNLSLITKEPKIIESKWSHVCYINHIKDFKFIKEIKNSTISVDIAGKNDYDFDILKYIDYIFLSDEDIVDLDMLIKKCKGFIIVHSNNGSITYGKNKKEIKIKHELINDNVNVLGAGDFFCSSFINQMLLNNNLELSLKNSHDKTIDFLKSRK